MSVSIPTARGDSVDSSELGLTLITETIFVYAAEVQNNWADLSLGWGEREEGHVEDAIEKLKVAKAHGVDTIVDRAIPGIGRFVPRVKKIAERSPVNIIVCTGFYTWNELPFFFQFRENFAAFAPKPDPTLEDLIVRDIEEGILDTGVRAGLIKCVTDSPGLRDGVRRAIEASARAHRRTGVPITTHTSGVAAAALQEQMFRAEGVDLTRVNYGHIDFTPPDVSLDAFLQLLDTGASISFDTLGLGYLFPPEVRQAREDRIVALLGRGYIDQIMLSNDDVCFDDLTPESVARGALPTFTGLLLDLVPRLKERGVTDAQVKHILRDNPRRFFETRGRGPY